jgi:hypothetical protein
MNGISAANLSESLVQEMQRTGFRALNLALVTSDKQRQRATKRPGSTPHFDRVVQKGGLVNYLILGLPDSSLEEMLTSIIHLMERPVLIGPSVFYATPGTESYRQCLERGLLTSPELALQRSTCFPVETPDVSRLDLVTLFRLCRVLNFIKAASMLSLVGQGNRRGTIWPLSRACSLTSHASICCTMYLENSLLQRLAVGCCGGFSKKAIC